MRATLLLALALVLFLPAGGIAADGESASDPNPQKIRVVFQRQEIVITMFGNPASRDFLSLLPLTLEFSDYAGIEKIARLPRRITTSNAPTARDATGDFTYYAPWGNLAVFYKGFGSDGQLYVLGLIESGKETLAEISRNAAARIEKIE